MKTNLQIKVMAMGLTLFIFLSVNSFSQSNWEKYYDNPVLENFGGWAGSVWSPVVIFEDGIFKMWFGGMEDIGYAESLNGINWTPNPDPVIPAGTSTNWNMSPGSVIKVNDTIKMWYYAASDDFNASIGYGWSLNNIDWNLETEWVIEPGEPGSWDESGVFKPVVYYHGNTYHMWYHGWDGTSAWAPGEIGYATSMDGINWVKYANNPVLNLGWDGSFYDTWVIPNCVFFRENEYHMWFSGWDGLSISPFKYGKIGYAKSPDGIEWTVQNFGFPILDVGQVGSWEENYVRYCSIILHGDTLKMWYDGGINLVPTKIGYAKGDILTVFSDLDSPISMPINVFPNPLKDNVIITYRLSQRSAVNLKIYNQQGQLISILTNEVKQSGTYEVLFDSMGLQPGIYFCVLKTNEGIQTKKVIKL